MTDVSRELALAESVTFARKTTRRFKYPACGYHSSAGAAHREGFVICVRQARREPVHKMLAVVGKGPCAVPAWLSQNTVGKPVRKGRPLFDLLVL